MYSPVQKGIEKELVESIRYVEVSPPTNLSEFVHRFWEIKTEKELPDDFYFHVLPDACVHIVFNLGDLKTAGITALRTSAEVLNLGASFHFVGIRFLPGVWQGNHDEIIKGVIDSPYSGSLPLIEVGNELAKLNFSAKQLILSKLVQRLIEEEVVTVDVVTQNLLANIDDIKTVSDMANTVDMSPRQLQRVLKQTTGFLPHDLLKVLRLQQSFIQHYLDFYADQSHYIHSFRKIVGYTPSEYACKFDV